MRKIIISEFVTLDGVMEAPENWQFPYASPDVMEVITAQIGCISISGSHNLTLYLATNFACDSPLHD